MDRERCTAVAVAEFGRSAEDQITVEANGMVSFFRTYVGPGRGLVAGIKGPKSLRFWAHFVPTPVQVGALTSPQAMLAPLAVEWAS